MSDTSQKGLLKSIGQLLTEPVAKRDGKLKILMVGTEAAPYATVGGFSYVLRYLSNALSSLGHDVRLFIPKFGHIDEDQYKITLVYKNLKIPTDDENIPFLICNVKEALAPAGVRIYFLENQEYYEKRANVYAYSDDPTRFALLSRGALEFIRTKIFVPDVIHCNDWHTGLIPNYLKKNYSKDPILKRISTVFTIHNLAFQGALSHWHVPELELDDGRSRVGSFFAERINTLNFMRRGILYADVINTVSKNYAKEVLTPEYGERLDKLLQEVQEKFFGIVNGLDYEEYDPRTDKLIEANFGIRDLSRRQENKKALQEEFDLPVDPDIPLFGFVGRLDYQKGVDLIVETMRHVMKDYSVQFVHVGGGDASLADMLKGLKDDFPNSVGLHLYPNFTIPRLVFAGSDVILYPSRFEPCGVVQLEAMRYGALPLVRKVGGLADTVVNFDSKKHTGTGFVFKDFNTYALFGQIVRAIELYNHPNIWSRIQKNAMKANFSWEYSANEYIKLYDLSRKMPLGLKRPHTSH